jgi:MFS family permease
LEVYRRHVFFLSASRLISITGSIAAYVALVAVLYDRSNHSGTWVAAGLVVSFGVSAVLGPWAGHLGDRYDRRRVMIAAELTAAAAFVGIAFAHSLVLLVVLAGVATAAESPFGPAAQALLVSLVPEEQRTWATATRSSSASAGMFVGGAIGGFIVAAFGGATAFLINAASFVISAAFVWAIKGRYRAVRPEGVADRGASEGFRFVFSAPALWLTLVATSVGLLGTGMINVAEYPLFVDMGGGSQAYGIAVAGWAVGGFIAGRTMRKQGDAYTERWRLLFGCGLVAVAIGLCGVVPLVGAVVLLFSIGGFAAQTRGIAATLIYQRSTPDHIRARAFAALGTANMSAIGVAMIVSGAIMGTLTPAGVCIACGFVGLLALLIAIRVPPRRRDPGDAGTATAEAAPSGRRDGWSLATPSANLPRTRQASFRNTRERVGVEPLGFGR